MAPIKAGPRLLRREFNQNTSGAKKAAHEGPVFITDRGRKAYVPLTIEEYRRLGAGGPSVVELLAMPGVAAIDFEPPRINPVSKPVDFT